MSRACFCIADNVEERDPLVPRQQLRRRSGYWSIAHRNHLTVHVQRWYEKHGFIEIDSYLHVYLERDDLRAFDGELRLVKAFAHYTGDRPDEIRKRYRRVHDDVLYEKHF